MTSSLGTVDVFRTTFSRVIAGLVGVVSAVAIVLLAIAGTDALLQSGGFFAVVGVGAWALFWRPFVELNDREIVLSNVLRTTRIPWPAVTALDSRWSFTVEIAQRKHSAWAAPGSSGMAARARPSRRGAKPADEPTGTETPGQRRLAEGNDADAVALAAAQRLAAHQAKPAARTADESAARASWNTPVLVALGVAVAWLVAGFLF
ncbi:hypothetical protein Bcav_1119 [Beutenbergia cavernae DSM 12333]|uniref:Uncharacterized protein n=1 Tax=Beutenbergia cavernae (strain ATCC BAA-8 / DSM 12333 / CCUG 43141 / JCM 11478 / NBRC 16432 / NCIMB 13614 / HKI 0122) TaxID=471853 RepID=C5C0X5_BEUC1|nr:hypothetical protein [Beutenbergia cavernae]ACQ79379.1 hypothetical protein Bcav_1119 [Beutenbergia cavernae DSM 12333]